MPVTINRSFDIPDIAEPVGMKRQYKAGTKVWTASVFISGSKVRVQLRRGKTDACFPDFVHIKWLDCPDLDAIGSMVPYKDISTSRRVAELKVFERCKQISHAFEKAGGRSFRKA